MCLPYRRQITPQILMISFRCRARRRVQRCISQLCKAKHWGANSSVGMFSGQGEGNEWHSYVESYRKQATNCDGSCTETPGSRTLSNIS